MLRMAAIDVGTNSVKLLVAEWDGRKLRELDQRVYITRLGEGLGRRCRLRPKAVERTLRVLSHFHRIARRHHVHSIRAVCTQVLRIAKDREAFLRQCRKTTGLEVNVLRGEEEARLAFIGATWDLRVRQVTVIDIGGGSTQITCGRPGSPEKSCSLPIGAVVLTERFLGHDPPSAEELHALTSQTKRMLSTITVGGTELIGMGGTVTTLAALASRLKRMVPQKLHGRTIRRRALSDLLDGLSSMTLRKRKRTLRLDPGRADIVVAGGKILEMAMACLGFSRLRVSTFGLRHGLLLREALAAPKPSTYNRARENSPERPAP